MTGINYGPQYASYGVAGEMLGLGYFGYGETRTYQCAATDDALDGAGVAGETVNYGYDALNRLSTAGATNGSWGQAFTYDGFGNLTGKTVTQGSAPTLSVSFDPATNRQYGVNYDANGNVMQYQSAYDVENRLVGDSTALYVYDHAGKRVKKSYQATEEYFFYGIGGQKLVTFRQTHREFQVVDKVNEDDSGFLCASDRIHDDGDRRDPFCCIRGLRKGLGRTIHTAQSI